MNKLKQTQDVPPIFVVNPAARDDRRAFMCGQLERLSLRYEFVDAAA